MALYPPTPAYAKGRGGAWDRRRREACRWLCTGFENWACHRFFGRLGHKVIGLNPDVWPPSKAFRQGKLCFSESLATVGKPQNLGLSPFSGKLWVIGLTAFNPDVWPPSKAFRQGKLATGSAMGVTTRLFIVFRQVLPQRVSLKPWLVTVFRQALAQWDLF